MAHWRGFQSREYFGCCWRQIYSGLIKQPANRAQLWARCQNLRRSPPSAGACHTGRRHIRPKGGDIIGVRQPPVGRLAKWSRRGGRRADPQPIPPRQADFFRSELQARPRQRPAVEQVARRHARRRLRSSLGSGTIWAVDEQLSWSDGVTRSDHRRRPATTRLSSK